MLRKTAGRKSPLVLIFLVLLLMMATVMGCDREVVEHETILRNGLLYIKGGANPFTGFVIGKSREGYRTQTCTFKKEYKEGVLDGISSFYYPNGKLESKVPYQAGEIHGYFVRYWDNGRPHSRIHFFQGQRGGAKGEMFWDRKGKKIRS